MCLPMATVRILVIFADNADCDVDIGFTAQRQEFGPWTGPRDARLGYALSGPILNGRSWLNLQIQPVIRRSCSLLRCSDTPLRQARVSGSSLINYLLSVQVFSSTCVLIGVINASY